MFKQLPEKDVTTLKQQGLLRESETAFVEGSVYVAEDLLTKVRRIIDVTGLMLESKQKLLHD